MDNHREFRPIPARRLFWFGVCAGFLLDIVGHTIDLYWRGIPATFSNIYAYGARTGHAEAWIVGSCLVLAYGAYVARQAIGAILDGRDVDGRKGC